MVDQEEESKPRALVVDDDDSIRTLLQKLVEHLDINVDTARDGEEAISMIDEDGYDVILLDLMMPHVDGFEVLTHIREKRPDLLGCTIIASAVPKQEIFRRLKDAVYKIHTKPFEIGMLVHDIRACATQAPL